MVMGWVLLIFISVPGLSLDSQWIHGLHVMQALKTDNLEDLKKLESVFEAIESDYQVCELELDFKKPPLHCFRSLNKLKTAHLIDQKSYLAQEKKLEQICLGLEIQKLVSIEKWQTWMTKACGQHLKKQNEVIRYMQSK